MEYKKKERKMPVCLECGDKIRYGRSDKKFCSDECRCKHFYEQSRAGKSYRRRVLGILCRNYRILDGLIRSGTESMGITELMIMGFVPGLVTSYRRCGKHDEFGCFDIKYIMTDTRVFSIAKMENFD